MAAAKPMFGAEDDIEEILRLRRRPASDQSVAASMDARIKKLKDYPMDLLLQDSGDQGIASVSGPAFPIHNWMMQESQQLFPGMQNETRQHLINEIMNPQILPEQPRPEDPDAALLRELGGGERSRGREPANMLITEPRDQPMFDRASEQTLRGIVEAPVVSPQAGLREAAIDSYLDQGAVEPTYDESLREQLLEAEQQAAFDEYNDIESITRDFIERTGSAPTNAELIRLLQMRRTK